MTLVVVDASVALKWFLRPRDKEPDVDHALALLTGIDDARIQMLQPAHFIAEVAAVLAREKPGEAHDDLLDLITIECRTLDTADINATALDLAIRYQHHLFDTLYHAVALHTPGATLITTDRRYYGKGQGRRPNRPAGGLEARNPMSSSRKTQLEPPSHRGKTMSWRIATAHPLGESLSKEKPLFLQHALCLCASVVRHSGSLLSATSLVEQTILAAPPVGAALAAKRRAGYRRVGLHQSGAKTGWSPRPCVAPLRCRASRLKPLLQA